MTNYLRTFYKIFEHGNVKDVVLMPLSKSYFSNTGEYSWLVRGDWKFVMILFSVGILILIFAVINYINLTVAQMGARAKEVAMRSLLGATYKELFCRLMMESTLLCFFSFLIGLLMAAVLLPSINDLLQTQILLRPAFTPLNMVIVLFFILFLGGVSGLLPALHLTRTKAIELHHDRHDSCFFGHGSSN